MRNIYKTIITTFIMICLLLMCSAAGVYADSSENIVRLIDEYVELREAILLDITRDRLYVACSLFLERNVWNGIELLMRYVR